MNIYKNQKGFAGLEVLIIIVVVAALAGVGYYVVSNKDKDKSSDFSSSESTTSGETSPNVASSNALEISEFGVKINDPDNRSIEVKSDLTGDVEGNEFTQYLVRDKNSEYFGRCDYAASIKVVKPEYVEDDLKSPDVARYMKKVGSKYYSVGWGSHSQEKCMSETEQDQAYQESLRLYIVANLEAL